MLKCVNIRHEFHHMEVQFPITEVQHVTTEECMSDILESQCFRARNKRFPDLSFWSVHIPTDDVDSTFEEAYQSMQKKDFDSKFLSMYRNDITDQFANSPVFKNSESRYGNFMFSFSLSDLLAFYKTQHCGDEDPVFKYLGTDLFKKEITLLSTAPTVINLMTFNKCPVCRLPKLKTRSTGRKKDCTGDLNLPLMS